MTSLNQDTKQIPKEETLFERIYRLAKEKDEEALTKMVEKGVCLGAFRGNYVTSNPIYLLAKEGDIESVEFLINQFKACRNDAVTGYAHGGHVEQVNQLIARGASRDKAVFGYAISGNVEQANQLIAQGANYDNAIRGYAISGNVEQVNQLIAQNVIHDLDVAAFGYAFGGYVEQVNQLIARGASRDDATMGYAAGGHVEQVNKLITEGGANRNSAAVGYAMGGHVEQVNQLITTQGVNRDIAVFSYARFEKIEQVNQLIEQGASREDAVQGYVAGGHTKDILRLMTFTNDKELRTLLVQAAKQRNDALDVIALQEEATRLNEIAVSSQNKITTKLNKIREYRQAYKLDYSQAQSLTKIGTRAWLLQGPQLVRDEMIPPEIYFHITSYLGLFSHYNNSAKTYTAIEKASTAVNSTLFDGIERENSKALKLRLLDIEENHSNDPELRRVAEEQYYKEKDLNEIRYKNRQSF